MATPYTDLLNWVMPDLPDAPATTLVVNAIRDAVIELCERALIYRQELQQILVLAPTSTTTSAATAIAGTTLTLTDTTSFTDGSTITVDLSDGTRWRGHQSGAPAGSVITLDGALNLDVLSGATVTKLIYLYAMTMPTGTAFVKGLSAWLNDAPLDPISQDDLDNEFNNTDFGWVGVNWRTDVSLPTRFYFPDDTTVGLLMPPDAGGNLRINAALKPTRASTSFPTWIYERYVEAIAHGAKSKVMSIPKKPYSNLDMAVHHGEMFNGMVGEARIRAARGTSRGPLRTHTVFGLR
jgi:hypothetical protein